MHSLPVFERQPARIFSDCFRRAKFSHHCTNTTWNPSSADYGQRILQAQGWRPGEILGANDTSSGKFKTSASLSPLKVALKDNTLGLGARRRDIAGESTTGLTAFQNLLGRLNRKDALDGEKEQELRVDLKKANYLERWRTQRFVSGGHLVGDKLHTLPAHDGNVSADVEDQARPGTASGSCFTASLGPENAEARRLARAPKRAEKAKREFRPQRRRDNRDAIRKQSSLALKVDKWPDSADDLPGNTSQLEMETAGSQSARKSVSVVPQSIGGAGGRHAVRQRYIQHKRMAMLDSKALNEV